MATCSVEVCDRDAEARGYCHQHYKRWLRNGTPGNDVIKERRKGCSVEGCDRPHFGHSFCSAHYRRWRENGDPGDAEIKTVKIDGPCSIERCSQPHRARGYCALHYHRLWRNGDPLLVLPTGNPARPFVERLLSKLPRDAGPDECWNWPGSLASDGYGQISVGPLEPGQRLKKAHRAVYELLVGPIPEGLEIDHLCLNRACVNPDHLEPVTSAENARRAVAVREAKRRKDVAI